MKGQRAEVNSGSVESTPAPSGSEAAARPTMVETLAPTATHSAGTEHSSAKAPRARSVGFAPVLPAGAAAAPLVQGRLESLPAVVGRQAEAGGVEVHALGVPHGPRPLGDHGATLTCGPRGPASVPTRQAQLARSSRELPEGDGWRYEPKLDGFARSCSGTATTCTSRAATDAR